MTGEKFTKITREDGMSLIDLDTQPGRWFGIDSERSFFIGKAGKKGLEYGDDPSPSSIVLVGFGNRQRFTLYTSGKGLLQLFKSNDDKGFETDGFGEIRFPRVRRRVLSCEVPAYNVYSGAEEVMNALKSTSGYETHAKWLEGQLGD